MSVISFEVLILRAAGVVTYGSIGQKFIHVQHAIPLHEVRGEYEVDPTKDLVPVCPNCDAIIHGAKPASTVKELGKLLNCRP
jgi:5-methylcytosine-specific restriction protein A